MNTIKAAAAAITLSLSVLACGGSGDQDFLPPTVENLHAEQEAITEARDTCSALFDSPHYDVIQENDTNDLPSLVYAYEVIYGGCADVWERVPLTEESMDYNILWIDVTEAFRAVEAAAVAGDIAALSESSSNASAATEALANYGDGE